jgi:acyl carrier protein
MTKSDEIEFAKLVQALATFVEEISLGVISSSIVRKDSQIIDDLNFDSLDYASLMLMGEQFLGTRITESNVIWSQIKTIEDLANLLVNSQKA